ncbi:hypothetical protein BJ138DRAFT_733562 [Hygrophoropsis aurantiaca]|uniref:Uncharacterized protein n=1 Tax=Hygrophoropsis aurantiaca TaxID=72124 RepID=A0ACB8AI55_9AGAM|nr:hypothetical protein BJ138DRAFT_733562 [Hygrophoropsis aurantiaca]
MLPNSMIELQEPVMLSITSSSSSPSSSTPSLLIWTSQSSGDQTEITPPRSPPGKGRNQVPRGLVKLSCDILDHASGELTPQDLVSFGARASAPVVDDSEGVYEVDHKAKHMSGAARPKAVRGESRGRARAQSLHSRHPLGTTSLAVNDASPDMQAGHKDTPVPARHIGRGRPNVLDLKAIPEYQFEPKATAKVIGLGFGLSSEHPLKSPRSATMPHFPSPSVLQPPGQHLLPPGPFPSPMELDTIHGIRLQPTIPADSPSPMELLPPRGVFDEPKKKQHSQTSQDPIANPSFGQTSPIVWSLDALCERLESTDFENKAAVTTDTATHNTAILSGVFNPYFPA